MYKNLSYQNYYISDKTYINYRVECKKKKIENMINDKKIIIYDQL